MKNKKYYFLLVVFIFTLGLFGCSNNQEEQYKARAIFYLNGGTCQENNNRIMYVYNIEEGDTTYIKDPSTFEEDYIIRPNYHIDGWYKTKAADGTLSDKWDFQRDKMGYEGVELYASWVENIEYKFNLVYLNDADEEVSLGEYDVNKDQAFNDYLKLANKRDGYSALGFYASKEDLLDDNAEEIGSNFKHPGGDVSTTIKIYVKYIKGDYVIVKTANQLIVNKNANLYIANDIDMDGKSLSFNDLTNKTIIGNNHKIFNFELGYASTALELEISLFKKITGSTIRDLEFSDFTVEGNIRNSRLRRLHFAPLAMNIENSTITNVTISGIYSVTIASTVVGVEEEIVITDRLYYEQSESTFTNCSVSITKN